MSQRLRLLVRRLLAFLLDWSIILVYLALLTALALVMRLTPLASAFNGLFATANRGEATVFVFLVIPALLYFAAFESSASGGTPGKRRIGLAVVDRNGARVHFWRALLRNVLKLVPWELAHASIWRIPGGFVGGFRSGIPVGAQIGLIMVYVVGGIYAVSLLITPQGQTLYDIISRTFVRSTTMRARP